MTEHEYGVIVQGPTWNGGWATKVFECGTEDEARRSAVAQTKDNPDDSAHVVRHKHGTLATYILGKEVPRD